FVEEIGVDKLMNALLTRLGIHQPGRGRNTAQQGVTVLRGKAKAGNFVAIPHGQGRHRHHGLVENAAKEAVIPPKGEDRVGHGFFRLRSHRVASVPRARPHCSTGSMTAVPADAAIGRRNSVSSDMRRCRQKDTGTLTHDLSHYSATWCPSHKPTQRCCAHGCRLHPTPPAVVWTAYAVLQCMGLT